MAAFLKRFKKKRSLSSELHSRWGDVSITHPTQGSWNQWDQHSGFFPSTTGVYPEVYGDDRPQHASQSFFQPQSPNPSIRQSRRISTHDHSVPCSPSFPTGYFDENIRRRDTDHRRSIQTCGIDDLRRESSHAIPIAMSIEDTSVSSCDEDDEEKDFLGPVESNPRIHKETDLASSSHDDSEAYDLPAKSPPLSVTARMRGLSDQSYSTDPLVSGSGSTSRRTSYTTASSVSATSMLPPNPRPGFHTSNQQPFPHNAYPPQPRKVRHSMVPSYDDLYG